MWSVTISLITSLPVVGKLLSQMSDEEGETEYGYQVCDLAISGETLIMLRSGLIDNEMLFYRMNWTGKYTSSLNY